MWGKVIGITTEFVWKPQCTEHPPLYSWYPHTLIMVSPSVLIVSPSVLNTPHCTHDIPLHSSWYPPLYSWFPHCTEHHPRYTHDIPPMYWTRPVYSMISPTVLNIPRCTTHPRCTQWYLPVYWTSSSVMHITPSLQCNAHHPLPRCTAQTLCRVILWIWTS